MRVHTSYLPDQRDGFARPPPDCEEYECDNAMEFVEALSPIKEHWGSAETSFGSWIFRGQSNAQWQLTASAHRPGGLESFLSDLGLVGLPPLIPQQQQELLAVLHFVDHCRSSSIAVPEDGQALRSREHEELRRVAGMRIGNSAPHVPEEDWPPQALASLFAIAQHHGVPTRLLDWTRSSYVAAYFAARDAAEKFGGSDGRLAVWAFQHQFVTRLNNALSPCMTTVEAPADTNPYLQAQRGLFTVVTNLRRNTPATLPETLFSFEHAVSYAWNYTLSMGALTSNSPWLRKITLPHREAGVALRLLDRFDINAATIYPDYNGVTAALRERRFWPSK